VFSFSLKIKLMMVEGESRVSKIDNIEKSVTEIITLLKGDSYSAEGGLVERVKSNTREITDIKKKLDSWRNIAIGVCVPAGIGTFELIKKLGLLFIK
jgi:hypothetical protein